MGQDAMGRTGQMGRIKNAIRQLNAIRRIGRMGHIKNSSIRQ
jgi:hypothetical protein